MENKMDADGRIDDSDPSFQDFRREMGVKDMIKHRKAEEQSSMKTKQRLVNQKEWRHQVKRTQGYLGLNTIQNSNSESTTTVLSDIENLSITGPALEKGDGLAGTHELKPRRADAESWVLFVCVDVEAFEFNQNLITEIGISTLATKDLLDIQPGLRGRNWVGKIRSHHFRIREHGHLINKSHVKGCPGDFDFGQSKWISIQEVGTILADYFRPAWLSHSGETYKVVLVGHDVSSDIRYFKKIGLDIVHMFSDCIDTANLYKMSNRDNKQCSLGAILLRYRIAARHLHNAGNDARFTLCMMVAIVVDQSQNKRSAKDWDIERTKRIEAACQIARANVCAELEGWSTSEGENAPETPGLPPIIHKIQSEEANTATKGSSKSDTESIHQKGPLRRQHGPGNTAQMSRGQSDLAAQEYPRFQDPLTRPYDPLQMASSEKKVDNNRGRSGRGQSNGRGRGRGRGLDRGRGRAPHDGRGRG